MKNKVKIRIETDPACSIPEVILRTKERTAFIDSVIAAIEQCAGSEAAPLPAYQGSTLRLISQRDILRVHTEPRKVIICTDAGDWEAKCTLQEAEEKLEVERFVRIIRFEIVNITRIAGFDFSVTGTIKVIFDNGSSTWVARRYVNTIDQRLMRREREGGESDE